MLLELTEFVVSVYDAPIIAGHTQAIMSKDYHDDAHRIAELPMEQFIDIYS